MTNGAPSTPDPVNSEAAEIDDMAAFLALTNRIATRLQATAAVSQSGVTLADWLVLYAIRDASLASLAEVARKIGVSRQRVHQQAAELEAAGLVTISRSEVGNTRQLSLLPRGRELLGTISNHLQEALASSGGSLAAQIRNARRSAARLAKGFAAAGAAESGVGTKPAIS
jgi:DNA-binding MarR family transcriptional regulator